MLDAALVGVECLNVRCESARAPVLHCFPVVELRHVAQRRTGKVHKTPSSQLLSSQMSRGAPHHLRQIHQQQQNVTQKQKQQQGWAQ